MNKVAFVVKKSEKCETNFYCDFCDYNTSRKFCYERHILTPKHIKVANSVKKSEKCAEQFYCNECDYTTSRKFNYIKHCSTVKHKSSKSSKKSEKGAETDDNILWIILKKYIKFFTIII
jgi:hypothetical protein